MQQTARRIAAGDLSARADLGSQRNDEMTDLGRALNAMAAQLEHARGLERDFILSVSHDLRTPLTSIRGYAEALADGTLDDVDGRKKAAEIIGAESRRLERLVADLLDLARLDAHEFSLTPRPVDAGEVVHAAALAFGPAADELGVAMHVDAPEPVPADADPERLGQIVANLVENALKYATSRIDVTAAPDGQVVVRVQDDGPGVSALDLPHVFDRLYASRTVPGRKVGTGLGLAIVRELSVAMGGTVWAEPGDQGTRFLVRLPLDVGGARPAQVAVVAAGRLHPARASPPSHRTVTSAGGSTSSHVPEAEPGQFVDRCDARDRPDRLVAVDELGTARRPRTVEQLEAAQQPVDVTPGVDAAHELLAQEAALRERHRVALEERFLRDRLVVEVEALARDTLLDPQGLVRVVSAAVGHTRRTQGFADCDEASAGPTTSKPLGAGTTRTPEASRATVSTSCDRGPRTERQPNASVRSTTSALTRMRYRFSDSASCGPAPGSASSQSSSSPARTRRTSASSLPCGVSRSVCVLSPTASPARSWETMLCRNELASGPVTVTRARSERSTRPTSSRSAWSSSRTLTMRRPLLPWVASPPAPGRARRQPQ